jgi:hypothetical protein
MAGTARLSECLQSAAGVGNYGNNGRDDGYWAEREIVNFLRKF